MINWEFCVAFIQALAEVLRENDLTEVKVKRAYGEDDSLDVRVSRQQPQQPNVRYSSQTPVRCMRLGAEATTRGDSFECHLHAG